MDYKVLAVIAGAFIVITLFTSTFVIDTSEDGVTKVRLNMDPYEAARVIHGMAALGYSVEVYDGQVFVSDDGDITNGHVYFESSSS